MEQNIQDFLKAYGELTKKYKVDFVNWPIFTPAKDGKFELSIQTAPVSTEKKKESFFK